MRPSVELIILIITVGKFVRGDYPAGMDEEEATGVGDYGGDCAMPLPAPASADSCGDDAPMGPYATNGESTGDETGIGTDEDFAGTPTPTTPIPSVEPSLGDEESTTSLRGETGDATDKRSDSAANCQSPAQLIMLVATTVLLACSL